jgi:hypothetical protein
MFDSQRLPLQLYAVSQDDLPCHAIGRCGDRRQVIAELHIVVAAVGERGPAPLKPAKATFFYLRNGF